MSVTSSRNLVIAAVGVVLGSFCTAVVAVAWTGPTSAAPNGNVAAPINVGTTDQVKNANLGVNGLAVFGNTLLQSSSYLNWGDTAGSSGYGLRDHSGTIEVKDSGGAWTSFASMIASYLSDNGYAPASSYPAVRAYVVFNPDGTILAQYNVASVSHLGTGSWHITFSSALSTANYAVEVTSSLWNTHYYSGKTTTGFDLASVHGVNVDDDREQSVVIFY